MNFMLLINGSQRDYDVLSGKGAGDRRAWTPEEVGALGAFMERFNKELADSGELVETRGLTRRSTPGGSSCAVACRW